MALNIMVLNPAKNQIPNQIKTVNPKIISPIDSTETLKNDGSIKQISSWMGEHYG